MSKENKIIVYVAAAIAICIPLYLTLREPEVEEISVPMVVASTTKNASFEWIYAPFEKEYVPWVTISARATYEDGTVETKEVETIEGGCNEYGERDADVYASSTMIICYYAGFGRYYKVVKSESGYMVQRKEFEEGSPDYSPPIAKFETLVTF